MAGLQCCCFNGTIFQTLKFAASLPSSYFFYSSRQSQTLASTLSLFLGRNFPHRSKHPFLSRALSIPVIEAVPIPSSEDNAAKSQWKASVDFKWLKDNRDAVADNIKNRNSDADLDMVLRLYERVLELTREVESIRGKRNVVANKMKQKLESIEREELIERGKNLKDVLVRLEADLLCLGENLQQEAKRLPNMTHPDVPVGDEDCSTLRNMVGSPRNFSFLIKDHITLGKELDLFDLDAAAEVSGSKFCYLKNEAVMLEMALVSWTLSEVTKKGFIPLTTPEIVRSPVVEKCGFRAREARTQIYSIDDTNQCLIGTAEVPIAGIHMDSILTETSLPIKYLAYSHCFRTEAGAASASKGLYRLHQFSKVEMFIICKPVESDFYLEELVGIEEHLFSKLGFHFKTLDMASAELGAPAYRKFDIEAWMPGLARFGEISSASNCTDYQSRRLGIRYRPSSSTESSINRKGLAKLKFVHTLNATACAIPRMLICLLENYQQEDGSVIIPHTLRPFMGGIEIINPK